MPINDLEARKILLCRKELMCHVPSNRITTISGYRRRNMELEARWQSRISRRRTSAVAQVTLNLEFGGQALDHGVSVWPWEVERARYPSAQHEVEISGRHLSYTNSRSKELGRNYTAATKQQQQVQYTTRHTNKRRASSIHISSKRSTSNCFQRSVNACLCFFACHQQRGSRRCLRQSYRYKGSAYQAGGRPAPLKSHPKRQSRN